MVFAGSVFALRENLHDCEKCSRCHQLKIFRVVPNNGAQIHCLAAKYWFKILLANRLIHFYIMLYLFLPPLNCAFTGRTYAEQPPRPGEAARSKKKTKKYIKKKHGPQKI